MNNQPLVSVVLPVHNDSKYIEESISSVINQTYKNLEIIVIDDFSTDDTVKIVESFNDARIKIIKNDKNRGAAYSRNAGIKHASGDYIAFIDGDDVWDLTKTEKQIEFMLSNNYVFTSCLYSFINEEGKILGKYMSAPKKVTHKKFLKTDYIGCITTMYKKDICPSLSIPDNIYKRNDYALWIKLSEFADCYTFPLVLASHRNRSGSISSVSKFTLIKHHKMMFQKLYKFSGFKSGLYALRNGFYYLIRKVFYLKKMKSNKETNKN